MQCSSEAHSPGKKQKQIISVLTCMASTQEYNFSLFAFSDTKYTGILGINLATVTEHSGVAFDI